MKPVGVPDYCEPLIGYRAWSLLSITDVDTTRKPVLLSRGSTIWPLLSPLVAVHTDTHVGARCRPLCRDSLSDDGYALPGCGIYAYNQREHLDQLMGQHVFGTVALWGEVVIHTGGYRGEYAYPQSIMGGTVAEDLLKQLAEIYRIPYTPLSKEERCRLEKNYAESWLSLWRTPPSANQYPSWIPAGIPYPKK
jgi:hypothetical protein